MKLPQPQPLLERVLFDAGVHQPPEEKSFRFSEVPAGGLDHVASQAPHRPDALVAVHHDEAIGFPRGHHHDRDLLPMPCQRRKQPPLPLRAPRPQVLVSKDQLLVLEVHGSTPPAGPGSVRPTPAPGEAVSRSGGGKSGPMSCSNNDLQAHCVSRPEMEDFARFFNGHSNLQPHCVSCGLPVDPAKGVAGQQPSG
jgi:hypothetical protein